MNAVLLDTSCIVALLDQSERHHAACARVLADLAGPLVTCEAVLAESCYLLRKMPRAVRSVLDNVARSNFLVPYRLADRAAAVGKLLAKYASAPMDLADACLVDLATQLQTGEILTLDSHFRIYRWNKNRPFHLLIETE